MELLSKVSWTRSVRFYEKLSPFSYGFPIVNRLTWGMLYLDTFAQLKNGFPKECQIFEYMYKVVKWFFNYCKSGYNREENDPDFAKITSTHSSKFMLTEKSHNEIYSNDYVCDILLTIWGHDCVEVDSKVVVYTIVLSLWQGQPGLTCCRLKDWLTSHVKNVHHTLYCVDVILTLQ